MWHFNFVYETSNITIEKYVEIINKYEIVAVSKLRFKKWIININVLE